MSFIWDHLDWWKSGECQVTEERINDFAKCGIVTCPSSDNLYAAMDTVSMHDIRVFIMGQDPFPDPKYATGIAFNIPRSLRTIPHTLLNIHKEYASDLKLPMPNHGSLLRWCSQGVFLWNAIPVCKAGQPRSCDWEEWEYLNREIIAQLIKKDPPVVFVFLGHTARFYAKYVDPEQNPIIELSHPSPRGSMNSKVPFIGSRMFTRINAELTAMGEKPIDWRLTTNTNVSYSESSEDRTFQIA